MDSIRQDDRSYDFLWLSLGLLPLLFVALLLAVTPYDYWWYLRIRRDQISSGNLAAAEK